MPREPAHLLLTSYCSSPPDARHRLLWAQAPKAPWKHVPKGTCAQAACNQAVTKEAVTKEPARGACAQGESPSAPCLYSLLWPIMWSECAVGRRRRSRGADSPWDVVWGDRVEPLCRGKRWPCAPLSSSDAGHELCALASSLVRPPLLPRTPSIPHSYALQPSPVPAHSTPQLRPSPVPTSPTSPQSCCLRGGGLSQRARRPRGSDASPCDGDL